MTVFRGIYDRRCQFGGKLDFLFRFGFPVSKIRSSQAWLVEDDPKLAEFSARISPVLESEFVILQWFHFCLSRHIQPPGCFTCGPSTYDVQFFQGFFDPPLSDFVL